MGKGRNNKGDAKRRKASPPRPSVSQARPRLVRVGDLLNVGAGKDPVALSTSVDTDPPAVGRLDGKEAKE